MWTPRLAKLNREERVSLNIMNRMDIDIEKLAHAVASGLDLSQFKGDVVGVKIVENEFGNIEPGGIGVQNVYNKEVSHVEQAKEARPKQNCAISSNPLSWTRKSSCEYTRKSSTW